MFLRAILLGIMLLLGTNRAWAEVETVSIAQLSEKTAEFDKKLIRLRFHYRDKIQSIDRERYCVMLFDKDLYSIWIEFTYSGLSTIKDLPTRDNYDASKVQHLFGQAWSVTDTQRPSYFVRYTTTCPIILDAFGIASEKTASGVPQFRW